MAAITTTSNADLLQDVFFAKRFTEALRRSLVLGPLGQHENAPMSSGINVRWVFMDNPLAVASIAEGTNAETAQSLAETAVLGTLREFGGFFELTRLFDLSARTGTRTEFVDAASYQASLSIDTDIGGDLLTTATQVLPASGEFAAMTADILRSSVALLEAANAKPNPATPGGRFYCAALTTEQAYDMLGEGAPAWFQAKDDDLRASLTMPFDDTPPTAAIYNAIVKTSTNLPDNAGGDTGFVVGKDAYGTVDIGGSFLDPRVIVVSPEQSVHRPLKNAGTIGWDLFFDQSTIDPLRIVRVHTATT